MAFTVSFLGTGAARSTNERNTSASIVTHESDRTLLDCGEGTSRQLAWSRFDGIEDIDRIVLTHLHQDHAQGLPSLLGNLAARKRVKPLTLYGPPGTRAILRALLVLAPTIRTFEFGVTELIGGETIPLPGFGLTAFKTSHTVYSLGYRFREPSRPGTFNVAEALRRGCPSGPLMGELAAGRDIRLPDGILPTGNVVSAIGLVGDPRPGRCLVATGDTDVDPELWLWALHADLLVTEATFTAAEADKARVSKHMTSTEAAWLARHAQARALCLTHISSRFDPVQILREAGMVYQGPITIPADFDEIEISYRDIEDAPYENLPTLKPGAAANNDGRKPDCSSPLCKGGVYETESAA